MIQQQIKDREQDRLLESEKKDQETKAMLEYLERLQMEDIKEMEEKVSRQNILMGDINVSNDEIKRQKLSQKEQEKLAELKVYHRPQFADSLNIYITKSQLLSVCLLYAVLEC